jgi:hypothetical protein
VFLMKNNKITTVVYLVSVFCLLVLGASPMLADKNGKVGVTQSGCTCHQQGAGTTISIQGVAGNTIYMKPSENRSFTAIVAHASLPKAGVNISVKNSGGSNIGTINSGTNTKKVNSEITHTGPIALSGGQVSFGFSWVAPTATGSYTMRVVACAVDGDNTTDGDQWNSMTELTIVVTNPTITVTVPNGGESVCKNTQTLISWTSIFVTGNVKIEYTTNNGSSWTSIATVAASSNFYQWAVPAAQTSSVTYKIRVSDATTSSVNDVSDNNFSILSIPTIVTHPKHDSTCVGGTVTYSVTTDNQPGYTYQWRRNTANIPGATSTSYTITNAQQSNVGDYDVVITGCSPVTSNYAIFQLNTPPAITVQQKDTTVCKGTSAMLTCTATGTNLTYQWKRNGTNVTGGTSAILTIPTVNPADTGIYTVTVSGKCPSPITSNGINLRFTTAPTFIQQPHDTVVCLGETVTLTAEATGNGLTYQWRKNGQNIENAFGTNYAIIHISAADAASYDVVVKNSCNLSSTSSPCVLKTREPVAITTQPKDTSAQSGMPISLTVAATGTDIKYQWQRNGSNRPADTLPTLSISSLKPADSGLYKCIVKNACGSVESASAKLKVTAPPAGAVLAIGVASVDYGCIKFGDSKPKDSTLTNVIINAGGSPLTINSVVVSGDNASSFSIKSGGGNFTLAPNEKHSLVLSFLPAIKGSLSATLEFTSNSSTASPKLALAGKGCAGAIATFTAITGKADIGTKHDTTIKICNTGDFNLIITAMNISGANASAFMAKIATPLTIKAGDCLSLPISFTPTTEGKQTAELLIKTDQGDFSIPLEGEGILQVGVNETEQSLGSISVYPNPSAGSIVFTGAVVLPMPIHIRIFDALGNSIHQSTLPVATAGAFSCTWDGMVNGNVVANGNYTALLTLGAQTVRIPFVIMR